MFYTGYQIAPTGMAHIVRIDSGCYNEQRVTMRRVEKTFDRRHSEVWALSLPGEFNQAIVLYLTDDAQRFSISQKRETALALNNAILDSRGDEGTPEMWHLRTITIMTVRNFELFERKLVVGSNSNPMFIGDTDFIVISGWRWKITGRRGERKRGPFPASKP